MHARDHADENRHGGGDEGAGRRDRDQAGQQPVRGHADVRLSVQEPHVEGGGKGAAGAGEHRVRGDDPDPQVRTRQGGAGVEPEPAEREDEAAHDGHRDVVPRHGVGSAVLVELAQARPQHLCPHEGQNAAGHVDHGGAGEVDVAVPQVEVAPQLGEPAAAPHPVRVERVDDGPHDDAVDHEGLEAPPFGHGARRDRRRRVHEHHLEQEHGERRDVVGFAGEEEPLGSEEAELLPEQLDRELAVHRRARRPAWRRGRRRPSGSRSRRARNRACRERRP